MIGFDTTATTLRQLHQSHKLPHAILFHGKKGIGKASFAKHFALELLGSKAHHPDLLLIEKQENKKEIAVDQIRKISHFINQTSAISINKFIIIDAADELNRAASNALLKILEEPHQNNFLFLISHNLGKLLPTIKSRCQLIKIPDLSFENFSAILQKNILKFSAAEIGILGEICDNSPAKAIDSGRDLIEFYELFLQSLKHKKINQELLNQIADKNFNFEIYLEVLTFFFKRLSMFSVGASESFYFDEKEVFTNLKNKFVTEEIFDFASQAIKEASLTNLHLDKKLLLINFFNRAAL